MSQGDPEKPLGLQLGSSEEEREELYVSLTTNTNIIIISFEQLAFC
jgi:hypothetical protein